MFNLNASKFNHSYERPLAAGVSVASEGLAFVGLIENGIEVVSPSAAAAGEKFAGFSIAEVIEDMVGTHLENLTLTAATVTLSRVQLAATLRVVHVNSAGVRATLAVIGATPSVAQYTITGQDIGVNAALVADGHIEAVYRYNLTVAESRFRYGQTVPGGPSANTLGTVGLVDRGDVYTSNYDTTVDWAAATSIKLAASGLVTDHNGTGVAISGARVISIPSLGNPFLGIYLA